MKQICGEKERAIFQSTMDLIANGASLHNLKAEDIARGAGIGKGTLYNYFSSKEEIVAKTLLYYFFLQMEECEQRVDQAAGFQSKCFAALDFLHECVCSRSLTFQYFIIRTDTQELDALIRSAEDLLKERMEEITECFFSLACLGAEEGLFPHPQDRGYVACVFSSVMTGYLQLFYHPWAMDGEIAKQNSYRLLLKGLS